MTDRPTTELSDRELEILRLIATGASNKEVAQKLFISTNTVKVHLRNIFSKVGVTTRTEAALYAIRIGLVHAGEGIQLTNDNGEPVSGSEGELIPGAGIAGPQTGILQTGQPTQTSPIEKPFQAQARWLVISALVLLMAIVAIGLFLAQGNKPAVAGTPPSPTPRWRPVPNLPVPRSGLAIAALENQIYAIGGKSAGGVTGIVERYDPQANQWVQRAPKPHPVANASAAVIGGEIYIPGGEQNDGKPANLLESYNPRQDLWQTRAPLPAPISGYTLVSLEGRLYLFGGWDGNNYLNTVYIYDPTRDNWTTASPMPTARGYAGAAISLDHIFVVGGKNSSGPLAANEVYYPEREGTSDSPWQSSVSLPEPRYSMGVVSIAGILQIVGGIGEPGKRLPSLQLLPNGSAWQEIESPPPSQWSEMGMVSLGTRIYAVGGDLNGKPAGQSYYFEAINPIFIPVVK